MKACFINILLACSLSMSITPASYTSCGCRCSRPGCRFFMSIVLASALLPLHCLCLLACLPPHRGLHRHSFSYATKASAPLGLTPAVGAEELLRVPPRVLLLPPCLLLSPSCPCSFPMVCVIKTTREGTQFYKIGFTHTAVFWGLVMAILMQP